MWLCCYNSLACGCSITVEPQKNGHLTATATSIEQWDFEFQKVQFLYITSQKWSTPNHKQLHAFPWVAVVVKLHCNYVWLSISGAVNRLWECRLCCVPSSDDQSYSYIPAQLYYPIIKGNHLFHVSCWFSLDFLGKLFPFCTFFQ